MKLDHLTRDLIEAGAIDAMVTRDAPAVRILSDAERQDSLIRTLAAKPRDDIWLFGYGSLIWNPTVHFVERRYTNGVEEETLDARNRPRCERVEGGRLPHS